MGKLKQAQINSDYLTTQLEFWEPQQLSGWQGMEFQEVMRIGSDGLGLPSGNNFSCPSTTKTETCAASKPKTLTLNGQAKPNTTTPVKSQNPVQYFDHQWYIMNPTTVV